MGTRVILLIVIFILILIYSHVLYWQMFERTRDKTKLRFHEVTFSMQIPFIIGHLSYLFLKKVGLLHYDDPEKLKIQMFIWSEDMGYLKLLFKGSNDPAVRPLVNRFRIMAALYTAVFIVFLYFLLINR
ncbi:MAG: hypothetical protein KKE20_02510 [Nanoarchaeota archaeon]|nr:hypothetical protein [Nanoarchaeota archaeon]